MQKVHHLVVNIDVHHVVVIIGGRVSGVDVVGRDALPSRELADEISMLQRDVSKANQSRLCHSLPILRLHVSVAQPSKLGPLLRRHSLHLLSRGGREVSGLLAEGVGGLTLLIQHLVYQVQIW